MVRFPSITFTVLIKWDIYRYTKQHKKLQQSEDYQGTFVIAKGTMTRVAGANVGFQDIPTANTDFGGIVIPGGARYWFEKVGETDLEILHITAVENPAKKTDRINIDKHKDWMQEEFLQQYEESKA